MREKKIQSTKLPLKHFSLDLQVKRNKVTWYVPLPLVITKFEPQSPD